MPPPKVTLPPQPLVYQITSIVVWKLGKLIENELFFLYTDRFLFFRKFKKRILCCKLMDYYLVNLIY